MLPPPRSTLFPYRRSSDLEHVGDYAGAKDTYVTAFAFCQANTVPATAQLCVACLTVFAWQKADRKSTRLNSSHLGTSYSVFCLNQKKSVTTIPRTQDMIV